MTFKIKRMKSAPTSFSRAWLAEFGLADRPYLDRVQVPVPPDGPEQERLWPCFGGCSGVVVRHQERLKQAMIDLVKENVRDFRDDMKWKRPSPATRAGPASWRTSTGPRRTTTASTWAAARPTRAAHVLPCEHRQRHPGPLPARRPVRRGGHGRNGRGRSRQGDGRVARRPVRRSVGFLVDANATITNCDGVADNYYIVISGSYNQGPWTVQDWMTPRRPAARSSAAWTATTPSTACSSRCFMRRASRPSRCPGRPAQPRPRPAYLMDKSEVSVIRASMEIVDSLRKQIPAAAFVEWPTTGANTKRWSHLGTSGLTYQSPQMGLVNFQGDPMMVSDYMDCYDLGGFREASYGAKGCKSSKATRWACGAAWLGNPGAGKTLVYRAEGFYLFGDRCRDPIMNARVLNLTA